MRWNLSTTDDTLDELGRVLGDAQPAKGMGPSPAAPAIGSEARLTTIGSIEGGESAESVDTDDQAHVIVVDDEPSSRRLARAVLELEGYLVSEAPDGAEALLMLERGAGYDLMVLDLNTPRLGGVEVLNEVRRSPGSAGLPVVILSGNTDPETELELLALGADDFFRKLLDALRFAARVKAVLRRARG